MERGKFFGKTCSLDFFLRGVGDGSNFRLHFFAHLLLIALSRACSSAHKILENASLLFGSLFIVVHALLRSYRIPMHVIPLGKYYFYFRERISSILLRCCGGTFVRCALTEQMLTEACTHSIFLDCYSSPCFTLQP